MDNRGVFLSTNFISPLETVNVKRRKKGYANKINVKCPLAVQKYSVGMGGVDIMDQMKSYYETDRKSKTKFYFRLFFDLLDLCVQNSFIVYPQTAAQREETRNVATSLLWIFEVSWQNSLLAVIQAVIVLRMRIRRLDHAAKCE